MRMPHIVDTFPRKLSLVHAGTTQSLQRPWSMRTHSTRKVLLSIVSLCSSPTTSDRRDLQYASKTENVSESEETAEYYWHYHSMSSSTWAASLVLLPIQCTLKVRSSAFAQVPHTFNCAGI